MRMRPPNNPEAGVAMRSTSVNPQMTVENLQCVYGSRNWSLLIDPWTGSNSGCQRERQYELRSAEADQPGDDHGPNRRNTDPPKFVFRPQTSSDRVIAIQIAAQTRGRKAASTKAIRELAVTPYTTNAASAPRMITSLKVCLMDGAGVFGVAATLAGLFGSPSPA
jgi:hypothetical protein